MGAGGAQAADAGLIEHQEKAGALQGIDGAIKTIRAWATAFKSKTNRAELNPSHLHIVEGALDVAAKQIEMARAFDGSERV
jgi:hypothetical protein